MIRLSRVHYNTYGFVLQGATGLQVYAAIQDYDSLYKNK